MSGHSYSAPRFLSYSEVAVGRVIQFGPQSRWGIVARIIPGSPVHWELIWVFGSQEGAREIVTPSPRKVYRARIPRDEAYDRARVLRRNS